MNGELLLMDELRKLFLEIESTPGEGAVRIVGNTTKDLEYYINLVDKEGAGFKKTDSSFERSSVSKSYQNHCTLLRNHSHL